MKKIYIILLAAILMTGCSKEHELVNREPSLKFSASASAALQVKSIDDGHASDKSANLVLRTEDKKKFMTMDVVSAPTGSTDTKAELYTAATVESFRTKGFKEDGSQWFPASGTQEVETGTEYPDFVWSGGKKLTFYAYANLPSSVANATVSAEGVKLNYYTPADATTQVDILLGRYQGTGNNGTAEMQFYHPMTSLIFKVGSVDASVTNIRDITLDGIWASGSVTLDMDTDVSDWSWDTSESEFMIASQSLGTDGAGVTPVQDAQLGVPFAIIPQDLSTNTVKLTLSATIDGEEQRLALLLDSGSWDAGKTYTYTLNYVLGPDPEYWVDLGMRSSNGYPLLISKYNVQTIDDGGRITFDTSGNGQFFTKDKFNVERGSYTSPEGCACTPITQDEMLSLVEGNNFADSYSSSEMTIVSNITSNILTLPISPSLYYLSNGLLGTPPTDIKIGAGLRIYGSDIYICNGYITSGLMKVTCENKSVEPETPTINYFIAAYSNLWITNTIVKYPINNSTDQFFLKLPSSKQLYLSNQSSGQYTAFIISVMEFSNGFNLPILYLPAGVSLSESSGKYTIIDNVLSFTGSEKFTTNVTITYPNNSLTFRMQKACFVKGTLITLADGSKKPVEEITYDDKLKVWNFDKGCYDSAKPFWITKAGQTTEQYYKMTFSDGSVLNILGPQYKSGHKLYNYTDHKFEGVKTLEVGKEVYTENGVVTLVSKEEVNEEVEFYCLMTEDHLNCFAEGVLASLRYNNIYPFDENMKFVKDGRSRRPYKEFKAVGISREWYNGLRLGEQTDDLDTIKKYVDRYDAQTREKPAPSFWQKFRTWWRSIFG